MVQSGNHMPALMIYECNYTGLPQPRFGGSNAEPCLLGSGFLEWRWRPKSLGGGNFSHQCEELAGTSSKNTTTTLLWLVLVNFYPLRMHSQSQVRSVNKWTPVPLGTRCTRITGTFPGTGICTIGQGLEGGGTLVLTFTQILLGSWGRWEYGPS